MPHRIEGEIQLTRPLNSLAREVILNLFRTDQVLTKWLEEALAPAELRLDEYNVLRIVRGAGPEGHTRPDIEKRMVHDPDRLLALIHKLKTRGLIQGTLRIAITPAGEELLNEMNPRFEATIEDRVGHISEAKLRTVVEVLETIRSAG